MVRFSLTVKSLFILLALLACAPAFGQSSDTLLIESFETGTPGAIAPGWKLAGAIAGTSANVAPGYAGNATRVTNLHDDNGANGSNPAQNNTLYRGFPAVAFGRCILQFDVCLASVHAGFGARITNGGVPTTGSSWAAAVVFEGDIPYNSTGPAPGRLSYQVNTVGTGAYALASSSAQYQAGTWHTVRIDADLENKTYRLYFGPRGGTLAEITPAGGVPLIRTTAGGQVTRAGGVTFLTSKQTDSQGHGEPIGDMYIDNVMVTTTVPLALTVADAKLTARDTEVQLVDKVVTAGTDQTGKPFFYVQEENTGIRIRNGSASQGDLVSVKGVVQRASDNGSIVLRNGEREINASSVTVEGTGQKLPRPVGLSNRAIGGGPLFSIPPGPADIDGYPFQPGVWASGTGASYGYDQVSEGGANNVGRYVRVWGKVVYADDVNRFFYIDDGSRVSDGSALPNGSTPPKGVRVVVPPGIPLTGITGRFARVTGIAGSVSQAEVGSPKGPTGGSYIRNVRIVRPVCEPFLDLNLNGFRDPGEAWVDTDPNGAYDGIVIDGVPGPSFITAFDRYGTMIHRGRPFLPRGIYDYSIDGSTLDEMVRQGFNTVVCFDMSPSALALINARGLKTLPCLRDPASRPAWMSVRNDPAILGWYVYDEPEGYGASPQVVCDAFGWVRQQDPAHIAGNSHFLWDALANYKDCEQFTLSDRYPIDSSGASSIISIADHLARIHGIHGIYYPAWQFLQCFVEPPSFGMPTPTQLRAMVYLSVAFNTKGYFFFSYQRPDNPGWPSLWAEAKTLNDELAYFSPFLTLPWTPVYATTSTEQVRIGGFRVGNSALIATVNVTSSPATATFTLPPTIPATSLTLPLEGGATQPLVNRSFTLTYQPYQTRVFLWGSIPAAP